MVNDATTFLMMKINTASYEVLCRFKCCPLKRYTSLIDYYTTVNARHNKLHPLGPTFRKSNGEINVKNVKALCIVCVEK